MSPGRDKRDGLPIDPNPWSTMVVPFTQMCMCRLCWVCVSKRTVYSSLSGRNEYELAQGKIRGNGGKVHPCCLDSDRGAQNDSSCPTERSPFGVEARDETLSMLSEPELWCCRSEPVLEVTVEDEVEEVRFFSLKSVMITVTFPTVMASCWAVLLSTFFSLGLCRLETEREILRRVMRQRMQFRTLFGCKDSEVTLLYIHDFNFSKEDTIHLSFLFFAILLPNVLKQVRQVNDEKLIRLIYI